MTDFEKFYALSVIAGAIVYGFPLRRPEFYAPWPPICGWALLAWMFIGAIIVFTGTERYDDTEITLGKH